MPTRTVDLPLQGGLNLELANSQKPPGNTIYQHNFEAIFGKQGYYRVGGIQKFDGQERVQDVKFGVLRINTEVTPITVGMQINLDDLGNEVEVLARTDNALIVPVHENTPAWVAGAAVRFGAIQYATVESLLVAGPLEENYNTYILLAQQWQRAKITAPASPAKGMHVWGNTVYVGLENGNIIRSSDAGWVVALNNLIAGGTHRFVRHNFAGAAETMGIFCADGRNRPWRYNSTDGISLCPPLVSTNATSASSVTMGTGNKTFVAVEANRLWKVGQVVTVWANTDRTKLMSGTVVSWTSGTKTLVIDVTSVTGSGTFTDWEIGLSDFSDKPFELTPYGGRMAYAFENGQLLLSDVGEPFSFTSTSVLLGVGDEITNLVALKGARLAVFCRESIHMLSGETVADMRLAVHSEDTGAKKFTAVAAGGNALFLSERGITSLLSSQAFGDFQLGLASRPINSLMQDALSRVAFCKVHRSKMQYRIYLTDGTGIAMTFVQEDGVMGQGPVSFSTFGYPVTMVCGGSGERETGVDTQFVADQQGVVYEEDAGMNFNGAPIYAYMHTAFWSPGDRQYKKRYRKIMYEMDAESPVAFGFRMHFDGLDSYYQPGQVLEATGLDIEVQSFSGGGVWNGADWSEFIWSGELLSEAQVNVQGVGRNMGLLIWQSSDVTAPFVIQSVALQFTPLGIQR